MKYSPLLFVTILLSSAVALLPEQSQAAKTSSANQVAIISATADLTSHVLTITGTNFGNTTPAVTLNGLALVVTSSSATTISATIPGSFTPGSYLLTVSAGGGQPSSDSFDITIGYGGSTGAMGATGPQGPEGAMGAAGPKGDTGGTGSPGPQGLIGPLGPQGLPGPVGPLGAAGPQGVKGDNGATGAQGPQGLIGPTGAQGAPGAIGPQGATGPQGVKGDNGATGAQGLVGLTGSQGATGAVGPQGLKGDNGATGTQGSQGLIGPTGLPGATGALGPQGATGAKGSDALWQVNGLNMFYNGGNVGVGNTNPNALFQVSGRIRTGSETGTTESPAASAPNGAFIYRGIVTRRVVSTIHDLGQIVARTDVMRLVRDGTNGGFRLYWDQTFPPNTQAVLSASGYVIDSNLQSRVAPIHTVIVNPTPGGFFVIATDSQKIVHLHLIFGNFYNGQETAEVTIGRAEGVGVDDFVWVGMVHSTYDQ